MEDTVQSVRRTRRSPSSAGAGRYAGEGNRGGEYCIYEAAKEVRGKMVRRVVLRKAQSVGNLMRIMGSEARYPNFVW